MNPLPGSSATRAHDAAQPAAGLRLGDGWLVLDRGGVHVTVWPDRPALHRQLAGLAALAAPVVRQAGGALIGDLSLADNLVLEPALADGSRPDPLLPEIDALFRRAGLPVDWPAWAATLAADAPASALLQARVGRALVADPDVLVIDAANWDGGLLAPETFSAAFVSTFPWRALVWATTNAAEARKLRARLAVPHVTSGTTLGMPRPETILTREPA